MSQVQPEAEPEAIRAEEPPEEVTAPEVVPGLIVVDLSGSQPESSGEDAGKPPRGRHHKPQAADDGKPPPTGIPTADEWQDFLGGTVLRLLTEGYLYLVLFKDIDETDLTPRERDLVRLTKE